eukprot:9481257-Pyramimonas_sp.AAC.2
MRRPGQDQAPGSRPKRCALKGHTKALKGPTRAALADAMGTTSVTVCVRAEQKNGQWPMFTNKGSPWGRRVSLRP